MEASVFIPSENTEAEFKMNCDKCESYTKIAANYKIWIKWGQKSTIVDRSPILFTVLKHKIAVQLFR